MADFLLAYSTPAGCLSRHTEKFPFLEEVRMKMDANRETGKILSLGNLLLK